MASKFWIWINEAITFRLYKTQNLIFCLKLTFYHHFIFNSELYNGIETNPNAAGSGLISFGCSERCPTDCASSNFGYYNRNIEDFDIDPSLKLECLDDRLKRSSGKHIFLNGCLKHAITFCLW